MSCDSRPLNEEEKAQVEALLPILEGVARRCRTIMDPEEGMSYGFDGLVKAIRTHDAGRGKLRPWVELSIYNHIREAHRREQIYEGRNQSLEIELFDRPDRLGEYVQDILELPDERREYLLAYSVIGHVDKTSKALGMSRADGRKLFNDIKKSFTNAATSSTLDPII